MGKICSKCNVPKSEDEFYFANIAKNQRKSRCRICTAQDEKDRRPTRVLWERLNRANNRESLRARARAQRAAKPKQYKKMARKAYMRNKQKMKDARRLKEYGITPEQFKALFESQGSRCPICRTTNPGKRGWHTDHDKKHELSTGEIKVRGILNQNCNLTLGLIDDNPAVAMMSAFYLIEHSNIPKIS